MPMDTPAQAIIRGVLDNFGLGALTDLAFSWLQQGIDPDSDLFYQLLRGTDLYKARFRANEERRAAGLTVLSEQEIIDFERTASGIFRAASLPQGFYDQTDDFVNLLVNDVSPSELQDRVTDGFVRVANADPSVRQWFSDTFGVYGDSALASVFLDPQQALPVLQRMTAAAEIGGVGANFGFQIGGADALTQAGRNDRNTGLGDVNAAFGRLAQIRPVFNETTREGNQGDDLTAGNEGLAFAFQTGDAERIRHRIQQRLADFSGGARVAGSQRGLIGTGRAR